ncbi:hypothetical protein SARC_09709, partial [Sphaeroforma arctica JP610]
GDEPAAAGEEEDQDEGGVTACVCGFEHDDEHMIACDRCNNWQHTVCMGLKPSTVPSIHYCVNCEPRPVDVGRAKAIQSKKAEELKLVEESKKRKREKKIQERIQKDQRREAKRLQKEREKAEAGDNGSDFEDGNIDSDDLQGGVAGNDAMSERTRLLYESEYTQTRGCVLMPKELEDDLSDWTADGRLKGPQGHGGDYMSAGESDDISQSDSTSSEGNGRRIEGDRGPRNRVASNVMSQGGGVVKRLSACVRRYVRKTGRYTDDRAKDRGKRDGDISSQKGGTARTPDESQGQAGSGSGGSMALAASVHNQPVMHVHTIPKTANVCERPVEKSFQRGLFLSTQCSRVWSAGEDIHEYSGQLCASSAFVREWEKEEAFDITKRMCPHVVFLKGGVCVNARYYANLTRCVRRSCRANAEVVVCRVEDDAHKAVVGDLIRPESVTERHRISITLKDTRASGELTVVHVGARSGAQSLGVSADRAKQGTKERDGHVVGDTRKYGGGVSNKVEAQTADRDSGGNGTDGTHTGSESGRDTGLGNEHGSTVANNGSGVLAVSDKDGAGPEPEAGIEGRDRWNAPRVEVIPSTRTNTDTDMSTCTDADNPVNATMNTLTNAHAVLRTNADRTANSPVNVACKEEGTMEPGLVQSGLRVIVRAVATIKPGDEITIPFDYNYDVPAYVCTCACGAEDCVVLDSHRLKDLRRRVSLNTSSHAHRINSNNSYNNPHSGDGLTPQHSDSGVNSTYTSMPYAYINSPSAHIQAHVRMHRASDPYAHARHRDSMYSHDAALMRHDSAHTHAHAHEHSRNDDDMHASSGTPRGSVADILGPPRGRRLNMEEKKLLAILQTIKRMERQQQLQKINRDKREKEVRHLTTSAPGSVVTTPKVQSPSASRADLSSAPAPSVVVPKITRITVGKKGWMREIRKSSGNTSSSPVKNRSSTNAENVSISTAPMDTDEVSDTHRKSSATTAATTSTLANTNTSMNAGTHPRATADTTTTKPGSTKGAQIGAAAETTISANKRVGRKGSPGLVVSFRETLHRGPANREVSNKESAKDILLSDTNKIDTGKEREIVGSSTWLSVSSIAVDEGLSQEKLVAGTTAPHDSTICNDEQEAGDSRPGSGQNSTDKERGQIEPVKVQTSVTADDKTRAGNEEDGSSRPSSRREERHVVTVESGGNDEKMLAVGHGGQIGKSEAYNSAKDPSKELHIPVVAVLADTVKDSPKMKRRRDDRENSHSHSRSPTTRTAETGVSTNHSTITSHSTSSMHKKLKSSSGSRESNSAHRDTGSSGKLDGDQKKTLDEGRSSEPSKENGRGRSSSKSPAREGSGSRDKQGAINRNSGSEEARPGTGPSCTNKTSNANKTSTYVITTDMGGQTNISTHSLATPVSDNRTPDQISLTLAQGTSVGIGDLERQSKIPDRLTESRRDMHALGSSVSPEGTKRKAAPADLDQTASDTNKRSRSRYGTERQSSTEMSADANAGDAATTSDGSKNKSANSSNFENTGFQSDRRKGKNVQLSESPEKSAKQTSVDEKTDIGRDKDETLRKILCESGDASTKGAPGSGADSTSTDAVQMESVHKDLGSDTALGRATTQTAENNNASIQVGTKSSERTVQAQGEVAVANGQTSESRAGDSKRVSAAENPGRADTDRSSAAESKPATTGDLSDMVGQVLEPATTDGKTIQNTNTTDTSTKISTSKSTVADKKITPNSVTNVAPDAKTESESETEMHAHANASEICGTSALAGRSADAAVNKHTYTKPSDGGDEVPRKPTVISSNTDRSGGGTGAGVRLGNSSGLEIKRSLECSSGKGVGKPRRSISAPSRGSARQNSMYRSGSVSRESASAYSPKAARTDSVSKAHPVIKSKMISTTTIGLGSSSQQTKPSDRMSAVVGTEKRSSKLDTEQSDTIGGARAGGDKPRLSERSSSGAYSASAKNKVLRTSSGMVYKSFTDRERERSKLARSDSLPKARSGSASVPSRSSVASRLSSRTNSQSRRMLVGKTLDAPGSDLRAILLARKHTQEYSKPKLTHSLSSTSTGTPERSKMSSRYIGRDSTGRDSSGRDSGGASTNGSGRANTSRSIRRLSPSTNASTYTGTASTVGPHIASKADPTPGTAEGTYASTPVQPGAYGATTSQATTKSSVLPGKGAMTDSSSRIMRNSSLDRATSLRGQGKSSRRSRANSAMGQPGGSVAMATTVSTDLDSNLADVNSSSKTTSNTSQIVQASTHTVPSPTLLTKVANTSTRVTEEKVPASDASSEALARDLPTVVESKNTPAPSAPPASHPQVKKKLTLSELSARNRVLRESQAGKDKQ